MARYARSQRRPTYWKGGVQLEPPVLSTPGLTPTAVNLPVTLPLVQATTSDDLIGTEGGQTLLDETSTVTRIVATLPNGASDVFGIARVPLFAIEAWVKQYAALVNAPTVPQLDAAIEAMANNSPLPSPLEDAEYEDWLWHSFGGYTDYVNKIDVRSQRKIDTDSQSVVILVSGSISTTGATETVLFNTSPDEVRWRMLLKSS